MLSPEQVEHFKTFGFLILKNIFMADEVKTIRHEFERRAQTVDRYKLFDGTERQTMSAIGPETPFIGSLIDDDNGLTRVGIEQARSLAT